MIELGGGTRGVPAAGVAPTRGLWVMRDIPSALWLVAAALAGALHGALPAPRWLLIHLLLLGAATHAIFVWSQYFAYALLRSRGSLTERRSQNLRLVLANGAAVLVLVGVPSGTWPITALGSAALVTAVVWHGASLVQRMRRSLPGAFGRTVRYYVCAAALLAIGATLGALAALAGTGPHLTLAHALVNLLGWVGITIAGTVVTLWPTVLRTRAHDHAATGAARALPLLGVGTVVAAAGGGFSIIALILVGIALYLAGVVIIAISLVHAAVQSPPRSVAALSMGAGMAWWIATLGWLFVTLTVALSAGADSAEAARSAFAAVPFLVAGFVAQVLIGALSYLLPVVLGGGPSAVRVGTAAFNRFGKIRVTAANVALLAAAASTLAELPDAVTTLCAGVFLCSTASFLPIMAVAMRTQHLAAPRPRPTPPAA